MPGLIAYYQKYTWYHASVEMALGYEDENNTPAHTHTIMEKFNRLESAQKIHANRGRCHMHAHQFWWA